MPRMTRRCEWRVIWISRVLSVDTLYRCKIAQYVALAIRIFRHRQLLLCSRAFESPARSGAQMRGRRLAARLVPACHSSHGRHAFGDAELALVQQPVLHIGEKVSLICDGSLSIHSPTCVP
jgi:hypothetical protein